MTSDLPEHAPFGPHPVPAGTRVCSLPLHVGALTALNMPARAPANATRVLLIPGYTGSKEDFLDFLPHVAERGWHTWAYSHRGQADSAHSGEPAGYGLPQLIADAIEVLEALGAKSAPMHVVGHSYGGVIARSAAIARPDLFASLVLHSSGARHFEEPPGTPAVDPVDDLLDTFPDHAREPITDDTLQEMRRQRALATDPRSIRAIHADLRSYPDRTAELARTGLPIRMVVGESDRTWPPDIFAPEAHALGADLTWIPSAAHSAHQENPVALAECLDRFWTGLPG